MYEGQPEGFILISQVTPGRLDRFADQGVPLLQERGVFRADYGGPTLRVTLGLTAAGTLAGASGSVEGWVS